MTKENKQKKTKACVMSICSSVYCLNITHFVVNGTFTAVFSSLFFVFPPEIS